jgi:hypothetical protein
VENIPLTLPQSPFLSADPPLTAETAPAADDWNPDAAGAIDHIAEIFIGADKLESRFVLDEEAFMAAVEDLPLFMRRTG